jgi:hypothetical protein
MLPFYCAAYLVDTGRLPAATAVPISTDSQLNPTQSSVAEPPLVARLNSASTMTYQWQI